MPIFWKRLSLWQKITIGLVLGLATGLIFGEAALMLKPIGTLFINLIKMLIVPLIFVNTCHWYHGNGRCEKNASNRT